ncbi:hypothetical protein A2U01_0076613, partial [Trifolium medium]|nr:hypothetical protein [Trifolium medium]
KYDLNSSANVNVDVGASANATIDSVIDLLKEIVHETDVVADVDTSLAQENKQGETVPEIPEHVTVPWSEKSHDQMTFSLRRCLWTRLLDLVLQ